LSAFLVVLEILNAKIPFGKSGPSIFRLRAAILNAK
jgi:hypothetical protein